MLTRSSRSESHIAQQVFYRGVEQVGTPMPYPFPEGTVSLHIRWAATATHALYFPTRPASPACDQRLSFDMILLCHWMYSAEHHVSQRFRLC